MVILAIFVLIIVAILTVSIILRLKKDRDFILAKFSTDNVIVAGHKGKGKDLLFNFVINHRGKKCKSNLQFNKDLCEKTDLDYLLLKSNDGKQLSYDQFLDGKFQYIEKKLEEKVDYYISDAGVFLPSQNQKDLCKKYPSLPITYALSRQLAGMNIHANAQTLNRIWDKLREQADSYFICRDTSSLLFKRIFITKAIYYDEYESAKSNLRPFKSNKLLSSKENRALFENYTAKNGLIKTVYVVQSKSRIKYDTREFHKILFGKKAPELSINRKKSR